MMEADLPVTLGRITAPTLLISGDHDAFVRDDQDVLLHGIPDARLVVYEGTGHSVHLVQPERVIQDLFDFLAKAVPTTTP
ncbi:MAG: alpha/beta hydrolase [Actinomycetota bacterium]|nr:alpha/beta hydrolase [Actinomycetota bacterium]